MHGGLRYLEYYEFRLVREALIEREVLLNSASHIIWPMRFVLPHSPDDRPAWLVRLGLFLYDHLGGRKRLPGTRQLDLRRAPEGAPILDQYTRGSSIPTAGWMMRASWFSMPSMPPSAARPFSDPHRLHISARRENGGWRVDLRDMRDGSRAHVVRAKVVVNAAARGSTTSSTGRRL